MKITAMAHGSTKDMINAFQNRIDELKDDGVDTNASTDVEASAFETHYILEDTYEAPQAGSDVLEFDSYDELINYLDDNPDVMDRINDGYACVKETTVEGYNEIDSCDIMNACNAHPTHKSETVESSFIFSDPDFDEAWETLLDNGVSEETLRVVTDINGNSVDVLNDIARAVFGVDVDDLKYN
jgi:hypothetical protein